MFTHKRQTCLPLAAIPILPTELTHMIVEHILVPYPRPPFTDYRPKVRPDLVSYTQARSTVAQLSMLSKSWRVLALPYLLREIVLVLDLHKLRQAAYTLRRYSRLARVIIFDGTIPYARNLTRASFGRGTAGDIACDWAYEYIGYCFKHSKSLQRAELYGCHGLFGSGFGPSAVMTPTVIAPLISLRMETACLSDRPLYMVLGKAAETLESLELENWRDYTFNKRRFHLPVPLPRLKRLHFAGGDFNLEDLCGLVVFRDVDGCLRLPHSLQDLHFHATTIEPAALACFLSQGALQSRIRSLSVCFNHTYGADRIAEEFLSTALKECECLQSFAFLSPCSSDIFRFLPHGLRRLALAVHWVDEKQPSPLKKIQPFKEYLRSSAAASLQEVKLVSIAEEGKRVTIDDVFNKPERFSLRKTCRDLGISLKMRHVKYECNTWHNLKYDFWD